MLAPRRACAGNLSKQLRATVRASPKGNGFLGNVALARANNGLVRLKSVSAAVPRSVGGLGAGTESSVGSSVSDAKTNRLRSASVASKERMLALEFDDGLKYEFHLCWLRDQCTCPRCLTSSGQKTMRPVELSVKEEEVSGVQIAPDGESLSISWAEGHGDEISVFPSWWLRKFGYSDYADQSAKRSALYSPKHTAGYPEVSYESVMGSDSGLLGWMSQLDQYGFSVLRGCPTEVGVVKRVANLIGPTTHRIYGETFDVIAVPEPINIAYTDTALEPHMDLAYYESPPGIQMLHCVRFDQAVTGGESTLIDAHAVAEELQVRDPGAFSVLSKVPATFQKDHLHRDEPLKMFYQRPHITTNLLGEVTAVFWSPPFEGPLRVSPEFVQPYYDAYRTFRKLLLSEEMQEKHGVEFRMQAGDMLTFNNRRMLHGRRAFKSANGHRHLEGCYLDVDNFLNKLRVLGVGQEIDGGAALSAPREQRFGTSNHY